ncbi:MAG TPA: cupin domain-containing protein [Ktedonobacteraceae bacterium]|nr:cupin domain-containing protein [Ktedonobacteraceae bacterium]
MQEMQVIRWQEATQPQESTLRKHMQQEGLSPYSWSNGPGETYVVHSHTYEKVLYCVRGSIRFVMPDSGDSVDLTPGDCLILPAHTPHSAVVGLRGVTCMEAARGA